MPAMLDYYISRYLKMQSRYLDNFSSVTEMQQTSDRTDEDPLTEAEEALTQRIIQRVLRRLGEVTQSAVEGAGTAATAAADMAGSAASKVNYAASAVGKVAGDAAGQIADYAKDAADFVQKYPGVLAVGAIGPAAPVALVAITALTARKIVESRRSGQEPITQLLFRVPESLRDEVKRLALDEKRQMDELLTEAVLDLLIKHGRSPKAIEN
jgi:hypothetical protein